MKRIFVFLLAVLVFPSVHAKDTAGQTSLTSGDKMVLTYNASYMESPNAKAPWYGRSGFIHPVVTPKGRVVSAGFPKEHMHQHGLMFAWTSAHYEGQPVDFWNSRLKQGIVEHSKLLQNSPNSLSVELRHVLTGKSESLEVLKETWDIKLVPHDSMHVFDLKSVQVCATERPLQIRKYHYGAMCIRGPSNWTSGDVMITSEGKDRAAGNHTRPQWVAMYGKVDGELCGIAAMSHPSNFRAPQPVRLHPKMPYFCFAPMVLGDFQLGTDKPYVSRFRFAAFDGEPNAETLDTLWKTYSASNPAD